MKQILLTFLFVAGALLLFRLPADASHIVGGEFAVTYNGSPNSFHIKLNFYRDCNSATQFDDISTVQFGIFDLVTNTELKCVNPTSLSRTTLTLGNACYTPGGLCVERGTYEVDVNLPNNSHGYYISYNRCCRNAGITNIANPGNTGNTWYVEIPDPSLGNSTPVFSTYPAAYWCAGQTNVTDLSATDVDGDSLVYALVNPLNGGLTNNGTTDVCPDYGPYGSVNWVAGYSTASMLGAASTCYINAANGFITVNPQTLGLFVVSVVVKEYRKSDGKYLGQVRRDVQYDVLVCTATAAYPDTTVCSSGSSVQMHAGGGVSYSWSPAAGLSATNISNPIATPTVSTTYTVTVTTAGGCTSTTAVTITINSAPTISASGGATICSGNSIILTAGGGSTYVWSPSSSLSSGTGSSVTASPTTTTTYTITGTDVYGCTNTTTLTQTVNPGPAPTVSIGGIASICNGSSTTLTAGGASTYTWSPSSGLSSTSGTPVTANPSSTTTYTVTGTAANGCTNTQSLTVNVNSLPFITANNATICSGNSVILSAAGASTYVWSPPTGLSTTTGSSVTAHPTTTTTYTITGTSASGCTSTKSVTVTVTGAGGSFTISPNTTICSGNTTSLTAGGATSYIWNGPGVMGVTGTTVSVSPGSTTTYSVTGTSTCNTSTATVTVTVNPGVIASASPYVTICIGQSTILSASGGDTYSWSPSTGLSSTTGASVSSTPPGTGQYVYSVIVTDVNGCTASTKDTVFVLSLPTVPALTFSGDTLYANSHFSSYQWYENGLTIGSATNYYYYTAGDTGAFFVIATNLSGCSDTADYSISERDLPVELLFFNAVYKDRLVNLDWCTASEINNDFFTVERTKDGNEVSSIANVKGAGTSNKQLYYHAVDENPFQGTSAYRLKQTDFDGKYWYSRWVAVSSPNANKLEIIQLNKDADDNIFQYVISNIQQQPVRIEVIDRLGRIIVSLTPSQNYGEIDFSDFAHGIYLFRVFSNNGFSERKFVY